jgi:hypothetical protein
VVTIGPKTSIDQPAELLVRLAAEGPERPLVVLVALDGTSDEERGDAAEVAATVLRTVMDDGVELDTVFTDALLASDGSPAPAADQLRLR